MTSRERLDATARAEVEAHARAGLARAPVDAPDGVDLVTNDYLALRRDPRVVAAAAETLARAGLGAGGARLLGGDDPAHGALERALAAWQGEAAGVCFPTGTAANAGAIGAILRPNDLAVCDARNHGSLVDAVRLCGARKAIVPRAGPEEVEAALRADPGGGARYVVVEGVHGMDGDALPLADLADVCRRRDALLVVDEAHALGLLGEDGAGAVAAARCADVVAARVNPCGKALGGAGGVVTCSQAVAQAIVHRARAYVFTTALPPAVAAGVARAVEVARAEPWRRERALRLARETKQRLAAAGATARGDAALVAWSLGTAPRAVRAAHALRAAGLGARPVRPPTVPEGASRVRLSFHADHADEVPARVADVAAAIGDGP